jgi:hypothetical protein
MLMNETWDFARLNLLISSKIEENHSLEYKAAGAFSEIDKKKRDVKTEITKDISAMANSNGGTIIYGIAEYSDDVHRHLPERIDPINRSQFSKEWLEHIISNIEPRIVSLKIIPIEIPTNPDHVVYVVEIPKATTAHQALDLKYYRRYNFECVAMPDYQIREVMNRQQFPILSVSATLAFFGNGGSLHFEIHNTSDVMARYFAAIIHTPVKWKNRKFVFDDNPVVVELEDGQSYRPKFTNALGAPLFPKSSIYHNFKFSFASFPEPRATISDIRYRIYADGMPFIEGGFDPDQIFKTA